MISVSSLIIVTIVFVIGNLLIGAWKLKSDSYATYMAYPNAVGIPGISMSLAGTFVGGGMFFAVAQMGYDGGWSVVVLPIATLIGLVLFGILASRFRAMCEVGGALTLFGLLESRLPSNPARKGFLALVSSVYSLLYFFLLAGQIVVVGTYISYAISLSYNQSLLWAAGIVFLNCLVYGVVGGLKKDIFSDILQMLIVLVALIVLAIVLAPYISDGSQMAVEPPERDRFGIVFILGTLVFFTPAFLIRYDIWQRMVATRSTAKFRYAVAIASVVTVLVYLFFIAIGVLSRGSLSDVQDSELVMLDLLTTQTSGIVQSIVALALYCAVLSSADTFLNISTVSMLHACGRGAGASNGDARNLLLARVSALIIAIFAATFALISSDIVELLVGAFSSLVMLVPSLLYVLFNKRPNAALAAVAVAIPVLAFLSIFMLVPSMRTIAFVPAVVLGIIIVVSHLALRTVRRAREDK